MNIAGWAYLLRQKSAELRQTYAARRLRIGDSAK